jgi:hypothetical protein
VLLLRSPKLEIFLERGSEKLVKSCQGFTVPKIL